MKKNDGSVDEGPVDESFIGSVPHATVAGDATDAEPNSMMMSFVVGASRARLGAWRFHAS
jgi:hypothetical protein